MRSTWSPDSSTLHWALGPTLYKADVAELLSRPRSCLSPTARSASKCRRTLLQGTVAFTNGRVITMKGDEVIEHGTVVVTGNRIVAVGPAADVAIPAGAKVFDVAGKTVMPGLIDMHGHIDCCYETGVTPLKQFTRYAALAFGVTTNFDPYIDGAAAVREQRDQSGRAHGEPALARLRARRSTGARRNPISTTCRSRLSTTRAR